MTIYVHDPARFPLGSKPDRGVCSVPGCVKSPALDFIADGNRRAYCADCLRRIYPSVVAEVDAFLLLDRATLDVMFTSLVAELEATNSMRRRRRLHTDPGDIPT